MIKCEVPGCERELKTKSGYASHLRAHRRKGELTEAQVATMRADKAREKAERLTRHYKRQYDSLLRQHADVMNLVEQMRDTLVTVEPQGLWVPPEYEGKQEEEEVIALLSDLQLGTKSLGEEIGLEQPMVWGPFGAFNFDILRYRLHLWADGVVRITEMRRKTTPIKKLNLWLLGDVLENEWIWRGQGAYIETGLLQQFFAGIYEVAQLIARLACHFTEIEIRGIAGNHGRGRPRKNATKTWTNWEWLWLRYLEVVCRDLPNVRFDLAMSWFDQPEVLGHRYLILHGEDARRYMRYPWYSLGRMEKSYGALLESVGKPFEYMCFGHHHVRASFQTSKGEWFCNGSFVGPTMFSLKVFNEMARASQWLLFGHAKRGIASRWAIDLMKQDQELWDWIEETSYDIHVPPTNQEILTAMQQAARKIYV